MSRAQQNLVIFDTKGNAFQFLTHEELLALRLSDLGILQPYNRSGGPRPLPPTVPHR